MPRFPYTKISLPFSKTFLKFKNALQTIETKIGFLEVPIDFAGILGVYGFLDHFSFKANIPEGYFELEPIFL